MKVSSISSFGFNCEPVWIETDLRRGIPSTDIIGIADSSAKETREIIQAAFKNSLLDFPKERILISLSPADLKKNGIEYTLAISLDIIDKQKPFDVDGVCVFGELGIAGEITGSFGSKNRLYSKVKSAVEMGFTKFIVPEFCEWINEFKGIEFIKVSSLKDAEEKLRNNSFIKTEIKTESCGSSLVFPEISEEESIILNDLLKRHPYASRAISIAIAGKLNILAYGTPGCGNTTLLQHLIQYLTPCLTFEELESVKRIYSIGGMKYNTNNAPFRMPHQTASIEGMCGGGVNCNPGEITLAHNGTLFLDEATEFRTSVLQMLRVPLENKSITLARAGRQTVYPANFQLAMAMTPCPCGNYLNKDKICLCSSKAMELFWGKVSKPLLDRIQIKINIQKEPEFAPINSIEKLKEMIGNAYRLRKPSSELIKYADTIPFVKEISKTFTGRAFENTLKIAITIANMDNRTEISESDWNEAYELQSLSEIEFI